MFFQHLPHLLRAFPPPLKPSSCAESWRSPKSISLPCPQLPLHPAEFQRKIRRTRKRSLHVNAEPSMPALLSPFLCTNKLINLTCPCWSYSCSLFHTCFQTPLPLPPLLLLPFPVITSFKTLYRFCVVVFPSPALLINSNKNVSIYFC